MLTFPRQLLGAAHYVGCIDKKILVAHLCHRLSAERVDSPTTFVQVMDILDKADLPGAHLWLNKNSTIDYIDAVYEQLLACMAQQQ